MANISANSRCSLEYYQEQRSLWIDGERQRDRESQEILYYHRKGSTFNVMVTVLLGEDSDLCSIPR